MIVTKKAISRRTILKGIGTTIALPFLDGMVPAFAATPKLPTRFGAIYAPCGMIMEQFWPATEGKAFPMSPILSPLTPFRQQLLVLGGLGNKEADSRNGEGTGDHARAGGAFLTSAHARKTDGPDMRLGTSVDQLIAQELGTRTPFPSFELTLSDSQSGSCDAGYACAYERTIAWKSPTTPVPMQNDPRVVFERMFGDVDSLDAATRRNYLRRNRSILDSVREEANRFKAQLGTSDGSKVADYLEAVRDIERRIQNTESRSADALEMPEIERPRGGIPGQYDEYAKLMFDLQAIALQTDMTRVFTFMMMHEGNDRPYPEIGVPDAHHPLTHAGTDREAIKKVAKINAYHVEMFAHFLEKLRATPDGDGTLLDHSLILYGSGMSHGNTHSHHDLPLILVGGGSGQVKTGQYVRFPNGTPMSNLHVTLLNAVGVPVEQFADSRGQLEGLTGI
jgi:Protein of unknown function (DUF1552)